MEAMVGPRKIELCLAAAIAGGSMFAAMVPGARSSDLADAGLSVGGIPTPSFDMSEFEDVAISSTSKAVVDAVSGQSAASTRFSPPRQNGAASNLSLNRATQVTPTVISSSGAAWSGRAVGIEVTVTPGGQSASSDRWWLVGGAGQESYAIAPAGLRDFTVAPVASEGTIGDAHMGVGIRVSERAYASVGYVREARKFTLGTEDWEEEEHFIGVGFHARW